MGEAIGQALPFAVGVALSPVPIIAVILILFTPKARTNSISFLFGWMLGLAVVGGIVLFLGDIATGDSGGQTATSGVIKLVLGLLLLLLAVHNWRSRPENSEEAQMPKWMSALDNFNAVKSAGIAFLLSGLNPKNLLLTAGATIAIATSGLSSGNKGVALAVYILIASITVAAPVLTYLIMGEKADAGLTSLKDWLGTNNAAVMAVLFLVFGAKLLGDGISILSA